MKQMKNQQSISPVNFTRDMVATGKRPVNDRSISPVIVGLKASFVVIRRLETNIRERWSRVTHLSVTRMPEGWNP